MTPDQRLIANAFGFLAGVALLVGLGAWAGYSWRNNTAAAELAECQRLRTADQAAHVKAAAEALELAKARETKIQADHQEAISRAQIELTAVRADAARVRSALERLRQQAAALAASRGDSGTASAPAAAGSAPADSAAHLLADMLGRAGEAAVQLAAYADEARTAGAACERAYRAVEINR